jgi:hypothetical protein
MTILFNRILSKVAEWFNLEWEAADSTWVEIAIWYSVAAAFFLSAIWLCVQFAT